MAFFQSLVMPGCWVRPFLSLPPQFMVFTRTTFFLKSFSIACRICTLFAFGFTRKTLQIADARDLWWISHSMTGLSKDHHGEKRLGQAANLSTLKFSDSRA